MSKSISAGLVWAGTDAGWPGAEPLFRSSPTKTAGPGADGRASEVPGLEGREDGLIVAPGEFEDVDAELAERVVPCGVDAGGEDEEEPRAGSVGQAVHEELADAGVDALAVVVGFDFEQGGDFPAVVDVEIAVLVFAGLAAGLLEKLPEVFDDKAVVAGGADGLAEGI